MRTNVKKKHQPSNSKPLEASAGSSGRSERGSMLEKELAGTGKPVPPEIQAAQQLLARIAVKILTEKVQKTDAE